jgi:hypothetical protein
VSFRNVPVVRSQEGVDKTSISAKVKFDYYKKIDTNNPFDFYEDKL